MACVLFFCFKQKTAYEMRISDWSSDVCSSDLPLLSIAIEKTADHHVRLSRATMPGTELQAAKANVIFHGAQVILSTLWSGSHCSGTTINGWQALSWPASLDISALSHSTRYSQSALYRNLGSERRRSDAHKATGAPWPWSRRRSGLPPPDELDRPEACDGA